MVGSGWPGAGPVEDLCRSPAPRVVRLASVVVVCRTVTVLVTGGAGYIGAHLVRLLGQADVPTVVVDDLSSGVGGRVEGAPLRVVDVAAAESVPELTRILKAERVDAVIHFAARKQVGESVERPLWYYHQNVGGLVNVLEAMREAGTCKLVFSSSAAVYGDVRESPIGEDGETRPVNPYGRTKLVGEWLVTDAVAAWGLRAVSLRYFNVAGAGWPELGDPAVMNLVTMVLDQLWRGEAPVIFGADYATPDGTCVRDFVHVLDLARAHLAALDYLDRDDRPFGVFNVGTGQGASVREVVDRLLAVTGAARIPVVVGRRAGDPASVVAATERIERVLGWRARATLDDVLDSAWQAWCAQHGGAAGLPS